MLPPLTRAGVHMVPEDGPDNPMFERLDPTDSLHVTVLFGVALTEAALDRVESIAIDWFAGAAWGTPSLPHLENETLTATSLHVALTQVATAREPIAALIAALRDADVPLHQVILGRHGPNKRRATLLSLLDPAAPPQVRYDDPEAWWSACFDADAVAPLSEDEGALFIDDSALIEGKKTTFAEQRGLPLHLPGLRICYGMGDFEFTRPSERALDVTRTFRAALDARLRGCWSESFEGTLRPAPYNLDGERDGAVDTIRRGGRTGYSCFFTTRDLRSFLHGNAFRYREYEVMLAVRDTVRALDLEPVVCWKRFTRRYVIQLWERERSRVHFAA